MYPVTDLVNQDYASYEDSADAVPLNIAMLEWFGTHALADGSQPDDPRLSPLLVPTENLSGLPAIVITAESDPLRDQGEAYALGLMEAGVHVSLTRLPGTTHGFFGTMKVIDFSRLAVRQASLALNAAFEGLEPAVSGK